MLQRTDMDAMLDEIGSARGQPSGALRLNTGENGARLLLDRIVPAFNRRYPEVTLELATEEKLVDIVADRFDAAFGRAKP